PTSRARRSRSRWGAARRPAAAERREHGEPRAGPACPPPSARRARSFACLAHRDLVAIAWVERDRVEDGGAAAVERHGVEAKSGRSLGHAEQRGLLRLNADCHDTLFGVAEHDAEPILE